MKKRFTSFISFVLVISLTLSVSVRRAYALATVGAIAGILGTVISAYSVMSDAQATTQQKEDAKIKIQHSWVRSSEWSAATWVEVSGDDLSSAVVSLTSAGQPCTLHSTSHNGLTVNVIRAVDEPYNVITLERLVVNSQVKNSYFGVLGPSSKNYVYYSIYKDSNSILDLIKNAVQGISTTCNSMDSYLYHIDSMLTSSLPALFTTQTGQGTFSVAELQYKVWQSVDGLEGSLSSIDSKFTTLNSRVMTIQNRLIKTVNGTSYTVSDLVYNAWQSIQTMSGSVSRSEGYLNSMNTNISGIYDAMYEVSEDISNSNFPYQVVSASSVDASGDEWPRAYIPYDTGVDMVSFLNSHYQNRKINLLANDGSQSTRWFVRADLSDNGYIRVYMSMWQDRPAVSQYYLCDTRHNIFVTQKPTYLDYLTATVNSTSVSISTIVADVDASLTNLNTTVVGLADAVANINASFSLGGLHLDIGDSSSNPIFTKPAASDLYLSSYLTDIEGNNYTVISSPYQSSTDIIGYINSEMVGKPITLLPRQGTREGELTRYVDHAYLDDNNYIRVLAKTAAGAISSYFLASPEMSIFQSVAQPLIDLSSISSYIADIDTEIHGTNNALGRLEVNTDGIEGLIRTTNSSLTDIKGYTDNIEDINSSILSHLDSSDLVDDQLVSTMVDAWGDHLVYTVLNSDNVLSLFNAAFGDLPSDLNWAGVRQFFQEFYSGGA